MNGVTLAVLGYVVLQLLLGAYIARRVRTEEDYLLAGRSLGPGLLVFTIFAICITVAEAAMGLAIVILLFRVRRTVTADHLDLLKG